jgi:hypothetical protein
MPSMSAFRVWLFPVEDVIYDIEDAPCHAAFSLPANRQRSIVSQKYVDLVPYSAPLGWSGLGKSFRKPSLHQHHLLEDFSEIEHFRSQVEAIDLINTEGISLIEEKVDACIANNPSRFDKTLKLRRVDRIEARQPRNLILDPSGFFIIYPKKEEGRIYPEHCKEDGTLNEVIVLI